MKLKVKHLKQYIHVLYLAYKDSRTPWYAKIISVLVVSYAISPIDLIPDFIPLLGYLDDLILIPLGIMLCIKLIPSQVITDCKEQATLGEPFRKTSTGAALFIISIWILLLLLIAKQILL